MRDRDRRPLRGWFADELVERRTSRSYVQPIEPTVDDARVVVLDDQGREWHRRIGFAPPARGETNDD